MKNRIITTSDLVAIQNFLSPRAIEHKKMLDSFLGEGKPLLEVLRDGAFPIPEGRSMVSKLRIAAHFADAKTNLLFAIACVKEVWHLVPEGHCQNAVTGFEAFVQGQGPRPGWREVHREWERAANLCSNLSYDMGYGSKEHWMASARKDAARAVKMLIMESNYSASVVEAVECNTRGAQICELRSKAEVDWKEAEAWYDARRAEWAEKMLKIFIALIEQSIAWTEEMVDHYLLAALWTEDVDLTIHDFPEGEREKARDACVNLCTRAPFLQNHPPSEVGHDLWLSRNGHGTGFFDAEYLDEEQRESAQKEAKQMKAVMLEVGDDGIPRFL